MRLHDMRRKLLTRSITAVDAQMESIEQGSMVRRCSLTPAGPQLDPSLTPA